MRSVLFKNASTCYSSPNSALYSPDLYYSVFHIACLVNRCIILITFAYIAYFIHLVQVLRKVMSLIASPIL